MRPQLRPVGRGCSCQRPCAARCALQALLDDCEGEGGQAPLPAEQLQELLARVEGLRLTGGGGGGAAGAQGPRAPARQQAGAGQPSRRAASPSSGEDDGEGEGL